MSPVKTSDRVRHPLSVSENLAVGSIAGALETCVQMPVLTYKFCLQEGRALPISPAGWYRGVAVQAGTVAPITALQFMINGFLQKLVLRGETRNLSDAEVMSTSAGAGAISAIVYSPVDLTTIQQQKLSLNPHQTIKHVMEQYGVGGLLRGFTACAWRESIYTAGYLGLSPVVTNHLNEIDKFEERPLAANIIGACLAGTAAALVTHPIDTVKTMVQADIESREYTSTRVAAQKLYKNEGFQAFFRGVVPRTVRTCGAFFICTTVRELAIDTKTDLIASGGWSLNESTQKV